MDSIKLTVEQESLIRFTWNNTNPPPSIKDLIKAVFKKDLTERSPEGLAIRNFIGTSGIKSSIIKEKKENIELSAVDKEFIENNVASMNATQMAKILFKDNKLTHLCRESRVVSDFIKTFGVDKEIYQKPAKGFNPPKKIESAARLINTIVMEAYNLDKIDGNAKRVLEACVKYLNNRRFTKTIESYSDNEEDQEEFIHNYVRHIHDKFDLNQQDIDIICLFAEEVINYKRLKEHVKSLSELQKNSVTGDDKSGKMAMSLVEAISQANKDLSKSISTQQSLLSEINEKRSARIKKQAEDTPSLLNLVAAWREEESRNKMIDLGDQFKDKVIKEIKVISDADRFKAAIFGMSEDELLYG